MTFRKDVPARLNRQLSQFGGDQGEESPGEDSQTETPHAARAPASNC